MPTEEILDEKTTKQKIKVLKLLNKHYTFEERLKKQYKTDAENKLNKNRK